MQTYVYDGPVESFGRCLEHNWHGTTTAVSERKARSNLTYQYKMTHGAVANSRIELPAKLKVAGTAFPRGNGKSKMTFGKQMGFPVGLHEVKI